MNNDLLTSLLTSIPKYQNGGKVLPQQFPNLSPNAPFIDIYNPNNKRTDINDEMSIYLDELTHKIMEGETPDFLKWLGEMESDSNIKSRVKGYNPNPSKGQKKLTASGIYQFTKDTVSQAKQRALNIGFDENYIKNIPNDPTKWSIEQSNIMALSKIFPSSIQGSPGLVDKLILESFDHIYDKDAWEQLYREVWHTNPDKKTETRLKEKIKDYPDVRGYDLEDIDFEDLGLIINNIIP